MAITKLMNIKQNKVGSKSGHLKEAIKYILNPKKTENGLYMWSNSGHDWKSIYDTFMDTKEEFGKLSGRQGYHFVISFKPGECNEETAFQFGKDFCDEYLKDYDYVYAVHNDQPHTHIHIIFNSIDFVEGYKYRYVKGDWQTKIQPITDRLCKKYHLSEMEFNEDKKIGTSYALQFAKKNQSPQKSQIICMDIDFAIARSKDMDSFYQELNNQGYRIREGFSKKKNASYVTFYPPGWERGKRSYKLGAGYSIADIEKRIKDKNKNETLIKWKTAFEKYPEELHVINMSKSSELQICMIRRVTQACGYQFFNILISDQIRVRRDLIKIEQLKDDCNYILDNGFESVSEVAERLEEVNQKYNLLKKQSDSSAELDQMFSAEELILREEYISIIENLHNDDLSEEEFESMSDRLEEIEAVASPQLLSFRQSSDYQDKMDQLFLERRVLRRIVRDQEKILSIPDYNSKEIALNETKKLEKKKGPEPSSNLEPIVGKEV